MVFGRNPAFLCTAAAAWANRDTWGHVREERALGVARQSQHSVNNWWLVSNVEPTLADP